MSKNLNNLTSQQFSKLVSGIKEKKFRVVSWQGTILMDLLEYAQTLVAQGNTSQVQAHRVYLQELNQKKNQRKSCLLLNWEKCCSCFYQQEREKVRNTYPKKSSG